MKIKEVFRAGGITQSIGGLVDNLDHNNCIIENRSKNEDAVILRLKRVSDGEEGNSYLRVRDKFEGIKDQLLNWAFTSNEVIGLTLSELDDIEVGGSIESLNGRLTFHRHGN